MNQERRSTRGSYDLADNGKYIAVYVRKDRKILVKGRDGGTWALIGNGVVASRQTRTTTKYEQHWTE